MNHFGEKNQCTEHFVQCLSNLCSEGCFSIDVKQRNIGKVGLGTEGDH